MKYLVRFKHIFFDYLRLFYHLVTNGRTQENIKRYIQSNNIKKSTQVKEELAVLKKYWGCFPMQYYTHDFYSKDCLLSLDEMKEYIPGYYFYKIIFPQYDNVKKIIPLIENKIAMNELFGEAGISQSNIVLIKNNGSFTSFSGESVHRKDLDDLIASLSSDKLFIKPVAGRGGAGIMIAVKQPGGQFLFNGVQIDEIFLANLDGDYVMETSIEQSSYMSKIYPNSVNTLRAITKRECGGRVSLIAVTLRMGVNGSQIDNSSAGGILIGIDLLTGRSLRDYATFEFGLEKFTVHPDTLFPFKDLIIPDWENVRFQIVDSAEKLGQINLVGWDAAITDKGVVMIEANTLFGLDHTQSGVGGIRDLFLSDDPGVYYERS